ncbi:hypothetical protein [Nitrosomonas sp. Nm51]|uniref:hypothetical protein n=1 Tax=Nitrosomonas sp. Nm51 TaxID=133720 RepID=UPI00115F9D56|nr:hypothetical protein [Nitrosomonas sp. Nm51]
MDRVPGQQYPRRPRAFHKLHALDMVLPDLNFPTRTRLEETMQNHIFSQTKLIDRYHSNQKQPAR